MELANGRKNAPFVVHGKLIGFSVKTKNCQKSVNYSTRKKVSGSCVRTMQTSGLTYEDYQANPLTNNLSCQPVMGAINVEVRKTQ
jgi:hypothetical protein